MPVLTRQSKRSTLTVPIKPNEQVRLDDVMKTYVADEQRVHVLNGVSHGGEKHQRDRSSQKCDPAMLASRSLVSSWHRTSIGVLSRAGGDAPETDRGGA